MRIKIQINQFNHSAAVKGLQQGGFKIEYANECEVYADFSPLAEANFFAKTAQYLAYHGIPFEVVK